MTSIELTDTEATWLKRSLIVQIEIWEDRLEQKRGTNVENAILERLTALRTILDKLGGQIL